MAGLEWCQSLLSLQRIEGMNHLEHQTLSNSQTAGHTPADPVKQWTAGLTVTLN